MMLTHFGYFILNLSMCVIYNMLAKFAGNIYPIYLKMKKLEKKTFQQQSNDRKHKLTKDFKLEKTKAGKNLLNISKQTLSKNFKC